MLHWKKAPFAPFDLLIRPQWVVSEDGTRYIGPMQGTFGFEFKAITEFGLVNPRTATLDFSQVTGVTEEEQAIFYSILARIAESDAVKVQIGSDEQPTPISIAEFSVSIDSITTGSMPLV